jgi:serine/threonine-protein kinase
VAGGESETFAAGLVGITLDDRYRLDALLGEGGMGAVFRATHLAMERRVAVKLLKPHLTADEVALQRFAREARATMKVDSDHAVKVLDFGITPHKDYYMVLEYLDGRTVQRELDVDGPFAPARVLHIAKQSLRALGAAHDQGLVHRDIKPDNILLMRAGDDADYVKILDFGVAKVMEGAASTKSALSLTQAGVVFGTPEYMSPEQACGQTLDGRSDLYALAATMFAMLTGCGMYRAASPIEWLSAHARTPPPHLVEGNPSLAPYAELDALLQRCLAKRREERPHDAAAMIRAIEEVETALTRATAAVSVDPAATLLPAVPALPRQSDTATQFTQSVSSDLVELAAATNGKRGVWLVLAIAAVTAMLVVVIIVASRKRPGRDGTVPAVATKGAEAVADAGPPVDDAAPPIDAPAELDAAAERDAAPRVIHRVPKHDPEVDAHVAAAEAAQRSGNGLRQLAESDAALQLDPHNVRARFLAADALIKAGDLDRGCKYLRQLGTNRRAIARARQAACPSD